MRIVAGVDGGGTRTRVALATAEGEVLGLGEAGPGNLRDGGVRGLRDSLGAALEAAWGEAAGTRRAADAAFLGLAGVATAEEREAARAVAVEVGLATPSALEVDHDLRIALKGGLAGEPGIVLIVGTGSSCYGRDGDGNSWRAGGWGSFLDDRGSAFDLGRAALAACVRAQDGRGSATALDPALRERLGLATWREALTLVEPSSRRERGVLTRVEIAALAPLVTAAAGEGDEVAREIIVAGARELALAVATVARELGWSAPRVAPTGGLARASAYREPLERAIHGRLPDCRIVDPALSPVLGAVLLALESDGAPLGGEVIARLARFDARTA